MPRKAPIVRTFMKRLPEEIDRHDSVARAIEVMEKSGIRHVPVMNSYHLFGIVSQRDLLMARIRVGDDIDTMTVGEVCNRDVLTVSPMTPVTDVAQQMLERNIGSALVEDGGLVIGIFTSTDALKALCDAYTTKPRATRR